VTIDQPDRSFDLRSVIPIWILAAIGAVLVGFLAPARNYLTWLPIALAGAALVTFCVQLSLDRKEGLVNRMMASLGGSVVILAIATVVLGTLQLAAA
jgi:hypothetical protein